MSVTSGLERERGRKVPCCVRRWWLKQTETEILLLKSSQSNLEWLAAFVWGSLWIACCWTLPQYWTHFREVRHLDTKTWGNRVHDGKTWSYPLKAVSVCVAVWNRIRFYQVKNPKVTSPHLIRFCPKERHLRVLFLSDMSHTQYVYNVVRETFYLIHVQNIRSSENVRQIAEYFDSSVKSVRLTVSLSHTFIFHLVNYYWCFFQCTIWTQRRDNKWKFIVSAILTSIKTNGLQF